ncbi:MAG: AAA family ATPase [Deltaproteobacteria bacterium]|nr:AAA family ATPase [Deltaproteobacteria bacterium]
MITRFFVAGFKPFGAQGKTVELAPLTIFVGPNGSGKTSLMEAMALLAQSASWSQGGLRWGRGQLVDPVWAELPEPPACLHRGSFGQILRLGACLQIPAAPSPSPLSVEYVVEHRLHDRGKGDWVHAISLTPGVHARRVHRLAQQAFGTASWTDKLEIQGVDLRPSGSADRVFGPETFMSAQVDPNVRAQYDGILAALEAGRRFCQERFSYIGPERGPSRIDRNTEGKPPRTVGKRGEATVRVLSRLFSSEGQSAAAGTVQKWAHKFGLASLHAGWSGGKELACDFRDGATDTVVSFDMAGFGSVQLLPVIVELFASTPPCTILVEEPEISLHPQAVAELPLMFADAVQGGRQVIVATHSDGLLADLHRIVGAGFPATKIKVVHFRRQGDDVEIKDLPISKDGLVEGWVPSFCDAEDRSAKEWLDKVGGSVP